MFVVILRRQWKKPICLILLFLCILFFNSEAEREKLIEHRDAQSAYVQNASSLGKDGFFQKLDADYRHYDALIDSFDNFVGYEGEVPQGYIHPVELAAGASVYANLDMMIWRNQMYQLPGTLSQTVYDDFRITFQLSSRLANQRNFSEIIQNHVLTMERNLRRGGENTTLYQLALTELNSIDQDFPVADTGDTGLLVTYICEDRYLPILLCLCFFGVFSSASQSSVMRQIYISGFGPKRFVLAQLGVSLLLTFAGILIYYCIVILAYSGGSLCNIAWNLPIQTIIQTTFNGADVLMAFTVWEYIEAMICFKACFCVVLVSIVHLVSLLSPNSIVSSCGCGAILLLLTWLSALDTAEQSFTDAYGLLPQHKFLLWGDGRSLFHSLCWQRIGQYFVPNWLLYIIILLSLLSIVCAFTIFLSKPMFRRWARI